MYGVEGFLLNWLQYETINNFLLSVKIVKLFNLPCLSRDVQHAEPARQSYLYDANWCGLCLLFNTVQLIGTRATTDAAVLV